MQTQKEEHDNLCQHRWSFPLLPYTIGDIRPSLLILTVKKITTTKLKKIVICSFDDLFYYCVLLTSIINPKNLEQGWGYAFQKLEK